MKKTILLSVLFLFIATSFSITNISYSLEGGSLRNYRSDLRAYRERHYRQPAWWFKYPREKANMVWVVYSKTKKMLFQTYDIVMQNNLRGAAAYNLGLKLYREGATMVHQGGMWRKAINWGLASRRMFLLALRANGMYSHDVPPMADYIRIAFRQDWKENKDDMYRRGTRLADGDRGRDLNIDLGNNARDAR
jgi:hypothetical protein